MAKKRTQRPVDKALQDALRKAYSERARLFVRGVQERDVRPIIQYLESFSGDLEWSKGRLGITEDAFRKVRRAGVALHLVFCHPSILENKPETLAYYRNLAALSKKGLSQIATGLLGDDRRTMTVSFLNEVNMLDHQRDGCV